MTPLEKARKRESEYCKLCVYVDGWFYCEKSGKLIHPLAITNDGRCLNKKHCNYLKAGPIMAPQQKG